MLRRRREKEKEENTKEKTEPQPRGGEKINALNSFFLVFGLRTPELGIFDLKFGFLVKNCMRCLLEMSRIPKLNENPKLVRI